MGGPGNGSGELLIKDSSGNIIVQGDSTGLHIYSGSISIQNTSGSAIIDSLGLNSLSTFRSGGTAINPGISTTSTSYSAVPNSTISPLILTRKTNVMIIFTAAGFNFDYPTNGDTAFVKFVDDFDLGNSISHGLGGIWATNASWSTFGTGGTVFNLSINNQVGGESASGAAIFQLAAGTHNFSAQWKSSFGGSAYLNFVDILYLVLGN